MFFRFCFFSVLFLVLAKFSSTVHAQRLDSLSFTPGQMTTFDVDRAGGVYAAFKNKISYFDAGGILRTTMVFQSWPSITSIDASNFHSLLCYCRDLPQMYFIDNKLNKLSDPINLAEYGLYELSCISVSHQACFSVYNLQTQKIEVYDSQVNKLKESMNVQTYSNVDERNMQMVDTESFVYLKSSEESILVFNKQCGFVKRIDVKAASHIAADGDRFAYIQADFLFLCSAEGSKIDKINLPPQIKNVKGLVYRSKRLYFLLVDGIHAFTINEENQ